VQPTNASAGASLLAPAGGSARFFYYSFLFIHLDNSLPHDYFNFIC
jgi:hypothetical protein